MADEDWPWLPLLLGTVGGGRHPRRRRSRLRPEVAQRRDGGERRRGRSAADGPDLKLGGLLAERVEPGGGGVPLAVLGFGLNVTTTPEELPVPTATSLTGSGGRRRTARRCSWRSSARWTSGSRPGRATAPRCAGSTPSVCVTVGRQVRVERPASAPLEGRAVEVARDGSLVVDTGDRRARVNAGDVVHVRPADVPVHVRAVRDLGPRARGARVP